MKLTNKQLNLIRVIEGFHIIGQYPTHRELAKVLGVTPPAVTAMLRNLEKKGAIEKGRDWRSIKLLTTTGDKTK
jgi:DNA-binding MarR family transcriptional regulator